MCLIVDANVATQVFTSDPAPDFKPVWDAILGGKAVAVHGGKLSDEYAVIASLRSLLLELERQGKVRQAAHEAVRLETERFASNTDCRSDDPHILGLAVVAKVRLLCSHDQALHADFTNPQMLHPAGSVYQTVAHRKLILQHCARRPDRKKKPRSRKK